MFEMIYTLSVAFPIILSAIGSGISQGLIGVKAVEALHIQPHASSEINKVSLFSMTLTETTAILGFVISILLTMDTTIPVSYYYASFARIGVSIAIGLSGLVAGIASSFPARAACLSVARQPFFDNKILQIMLITQTVIMTSNLFGFLIALLIMGQTATVNDLNSALQLLAAGFSIGIGSIGPCIGLSIFAAASCSAIGINRKSYSKIFSFTFIGEAMIETPVIFSFVIALIILMAQVKPSESMIQGITYIAAALCMGLSTIGTGISAGKTAAAASEQMGNKPELHSSLQKISLISLAMIDTCAIYGFIISIMLLYAI